ncbi:MAG: hypothetical protein ACE5E7_13410 [Anaerolineae bacterium]
MGLSPVITRVLSVPGLETNTIFVGLVVDGNRIAWGNCVQAASPFQPESYPHFEAEEARQSIQEMVVPILTGRPLADFKVLVAGIDAVRETAVITHHQPQPQNPTGSVSRRDFLTGRLWATESGTKQITVERPLHPAIRFGVSQALAAALAQEQGVTLAELIAADYNLPRSPLPVPIHLELDGEEAVPEASLLTPKIGSLGYRIAGDNPQAQLGKSGERLQQFVRQLAAFITHAAPPSYRPTIHLDVAGGLGQLFDNDAGRILGALYGLEQAAKPYQVRVADPALLDEQETQMELMGQIKEYIRIRGLKLQLAAVAGIHSLADVEAFVQAEAADYLVLSMPRLGSIHQVVQAILTCQRGEAAVILEGPAETAVPIALAAQPQLIAASAGPHGHRALSKVHDEMTRTLVWLMA